MSQALLAYIVPWVVPDEPQPDMAVGENFQQFSGVGDPVLEHPAGWQRTGYYTEDNPRPGQSIGTPDTYTPSPLTGLANTLGAGQAAMPEYGPAGESVYRPPGSAALVVTPSVQFRLGVGQHGPSELGVAQTVQLSSITGNPPQPGDLTSILAGYG